mgnify:CR=1 FL=1
MDKIIVKGARENNLKNISIEPKRLDIDWKSLLIKLGVMLIVVFLLMWVISLFSGDKKDGLTFVELLGLLTIVLELLLPLLELLLESLLSLFPKRILYRFKIT